MICNAKTLSGNQIYPVKKDGSSLLPDYISTAIYEQKLYAYKKVTAFYLDTHEVIYTVGLGDDKALSRVQYQELFSAISNEVKVNATLNIDLFDQTVLNAYELAELFSETYYLKLFKFKDFKTKEDELGKENFIQLYSKYDLTASIESGKINADGVNHARQLVFLPPSQMTAIDLADYVTGFCKSNDVDVTVYDLKGIKKLGLGGLLAVNRGSEREPRFIVAEYRNNPESKEKIALVGKGLTYDTGGYSLKPKDGMPGMKSDMGGAASVIGAFEIIVRKKMKANVLLIIPSTDNMIGSKAIVPDDIIVSYSKKTVEVNNTDAEGRLILMDGLAYANTLGATKIIDAATLTGGVLVALGLETTGVMGNNQAFITDFLKTERHTLEGMWQLPLTKEVKEAVKKSDVADLLNSGGRYGHSIYAGAFLENFVGNTDWIHLDVAGTSMQKAPSTIGPKGPTGSMVRTIAKYIENNQG